VGDPGPPFSFFFSCHSDVSFFLGPLICECYESGCPRPHFALFPLRVDLLIFFERWVFFGQLFSLLKRGLRRCLLFFFPTPTSLFLSHESKNSLPAPSTLGTFAFPPTGVAALLLPIRSLDGVQIWVLFDSSLLTSFVAKTGGNFLKTAGEMEGFI